MDTEALKSLLSDFDLTKFVPALDTVLGWIEMLTRIAVMVGPVLMLGFGLLYLLAPPKEANYSLGYRFWWSMASLDAWQFTHRWAGIVWSILGLILTVIMAFVVNAFRRMAPMDMVWVAVKSLGWEIVITALSCLGINIAVIAVFDRNGFRRRDYE